MHDILGRKKKKTEKIEDTAQKVEDDDDADNADDEKRPFSAGAEALLKRFLPTLEGIAQKVTS